MATVSDSRSSEFSPQDVCLPGRPLEVLLDCCLDCRIMVQARDVELAKEFLKSPCKLKNFSTSIKCSVPSVSAYVPCGQHTHISTWIKSPSAL